MSALNTCIDIHSGVTSDGNTVWTYTCNQSNAQKWKLTKADNKTIENGTYTIANSVNKNQVLTVSKESSDNFANVELDSLKIFRHRDLKWNMSETDIIRSWQNTREKA